MFQQKKGSLWAFFAVGLYYLLTRVYLFVRYGDATFGYDLGIYRRIIIDHMGVDPQPAFFFGDVSRVLTSMGVSVDVILYVGYIVVALFVFLLFVWLVYQLVGRTVALTASWLFATSLVQFEFFWWYYYRNSIAVGAMLAILIALHKRCWWGWIPTVVLVSFHPVSVIPVVVTCGIYMLLTRNWDIVKYIGVHVGIVGSLTFLAHWSEFSRYVEIFISTVGTTPNDTTAFANELTGQFLSLRTYVWYTLLYIVFGIIGWWKYRNEYPLVSALLVANILLYVVQVLLFRRLLIGIDIAIIFFASVCIVRLLPLLPTYVRYGAVGVYSLYLVGVSLFHVLSHQPGIDPALLDTIRGIEMAIPSEQAIMVLDTTYAPWVLGFAGQHTIIAPGMLDANIWDYNRWVEFWQTTDNTKRASMLQEYPYDAIYIYTPNPSYIAQFEQDANLEQVTEGVWRFGPN